MPKVKPLRTIDVARRAGVSVNTVREYERLGYLPPVPRAANGYRLFDERHVLHVILVRQAMRCTWTGGDIRRAALDVLLTAAQGDYHAAQNGAAALLEMLHAEQAYAEQAVQMLAHWATRSSVLAERPPLRIGAVAERLQVTIDALRNWERNGLLTVPRAANGYRMYDRAELDRLLVIRSRSPRAKARGSV